MSYNFLQILFLNENQRQKVMRLVSICLKPIKNIRLGHGVGKKKTKKEIEKKGKENKKPKTE